MQFIVPQFIDVENKIIGPISVRQFIILLAGAILIYLDYQIFANLNFWFFAGGAVFLFGLSGTFAFLKINGRPFHYFILNIFNTLKEPRLRVWHKTSSQMKFKEEKVIPPPVIPVKKPLSASRLAELSLIVDTGGAYHDEEDLLEEETEIEKMNIKSNTPKKYGR